jgi:hypothetical protein
MNCVASQATNLAASRLIRQSCSVAIPNELQVLADCAKSLKSDSNAGDLKSPVQLAAEPFHVVVLHPGQHLIRKRPALGLTLGYLFLTAFPARAHWL